MLKEGIKGAEGALKMYLWWGYESMDVCWGCIYGLKMCVY